MIIRSEFDYIAESRVSKRLPTLEDLKKAACEVFGLDYSTFSMNNHWRKREFVIARQFVMRELISNHDYTLERCGSVFNKNHATVIHACRNINDLLSVKDKVIVDKYEQFKEILKYEN